MFALGHVTSLDQNPQRRSASLARRMAEPARSSLGSGIPADWRVPWLMRTRLDAKGKRRARHPINAMLNAVFAVTEGSLAAYLAATGLSPAIGFFAFG